MVLLALSLSTFLYKMFTKLSDQSSFCIIHLANSRLHVDLYQLLCILEKNCVKGKHSIVRLQVSGSVLISDTFFNSLSCVHCKGIIFYGEQALVSIFFCLLICEEFLLSKLISSLVLALHMHFQIPVMLRSFIVSSANLPRLLDSFSSHCIFWVFLILFINFFWIC